MSPRDIALGKANGIAFLAPNRELLTDEGDHCGLALVVLDDELVHWSVSFQPTPEESAKVV